MEQFGGQAIAITVIIFNFKEDIDKNIITIIPITLFLLLIKDSAKIFIIIDILLVVYYCRKKLTTKTTLISILTLIILPIVFWILWTQYVINAYPLSPYNSNEFVISISKLSSSLSNKPQNSSYIILVLFVHALYNLKDNMILRLFFIIIPMLFFLIINKQKNLYITLLTTCIFYIIRLYVLYATLMPYQEALLLSGFDRYIGTIVIYG